jgi:chromosome segregation ATPase
MAFILKFLTSKIGIAFIGLGVAACLWFMYSNANKKLIQAEYKLEIQDQVIAKYEESIKKANILVDEYTKKQTELIRVKAIEKANLIKTIAKLKTENDSLIKGMTDYRADLDRLNELLKNATPEQIEALKLKISEKQKQIEDLQRYIKGINCLSVEIPEEIIKELLQ